MKRIAFSLSLVSILFVGGAISIIVLRGDPSTSISTFSSGTLVNVLPNQPQKSEDDVTISSVNTALVSAVLMVGEKRYETQVEKNSTAYDLMNIVQEQQDFSFGGRSFPGLGFFIGEINGISEDPRNRMF